MPIGFRTAVLLSVLLAAATPRTAHAMWPLDRHARMRGDSLTSTQWQDRFQTWKERPPGADSSQAAAAQLEALRKAAASGAFDPALLARLARQAHSGVPSSAMAPAAPDSARTSAGAGGGASLVPGQVIGGAAVAAPDSVAAGDFGAGADSLATSGFGAAVDSSAAASSSSATGPFGGPFGRPASTSPPAEFVDRGFAPSFQAGLTSNNDRMRLTSSLSASLADRGGITLSANLGHDQELRLSQDAENESNNVSTAVTVPLRRPGLTFGVSASSMRRNSLGAPTTTGRTTDHSENRLASLQASLSRPIVPGLKLDLGYARSLTVDEQNLVYTQSAAANSRSTQTTGNSYGAGLGFDRFSWLKLRARYGRATSDQLFTIDGTPSEQPSSGDTLGIRAELPLGRFLPQLTADLQVRRTDFSYSDLARTSSGASTSGFGIETETRFSRVLRLSGRAEPLRMLSADYGVELSRDSVSAVQRKTLYEDSKRLRWNVAATLRYTSGGHLRLSLDGMRADVNKDNPQNLTQPLNPQTRRDESRSLSAEVQQSLTKTLRVRAYGNVELQQGFYEHEGPTGLGDRDDFRSQVGVDLDGQISSKARARVQTYVRTFDQAFIDRRRSKDSRDETEYVVRQSFDYQITPQVLVRQFYGLSSKIVDTIFETVGSGQTRDTLNRNHFVQTTLNYQMTSRLVLDGRYDYRLQDNGFYLPKQPGSTARIFAPSARTKTDEVALGLRYSLIHGNKLNFISNQVATREHRTSFASGRPVGTTVTDRGNLALGLKSNIQMGDFRLDAEVTRNQSFNVSLNRDVYYYVVSTLTYTF